MARRNKGRDVHGILLLNKPLGLTSNQALQRVKQFFGAKKAGHTGALDPLATGLLPICLGEATKFSQLLLESDKIYETTARLGEVRSTGDLEGEVIQTAVVADFTLEQVNGVLQRFTGDVEQVPPLFSALKLDGRPLHELAREGLSTEDAIVIAEKKRRTIRIHSLELEAQRQDALDLLVHCSKGTYIRTLVEDIGKALECGACVTRLHRIATGPYRPENMIELETLEQLAEGNDLASMEALLLPMESAIPDWPCLELSLEEARRIRRGQSVVKAGLNDQPSVQLWACDSGVRQLIGVGRVRDGEVRSSRVLNIDLVFDAL